MTPEEIARGLTKAQREAVLNARPHPYNPDILCVCADKRVRRNLLRVGLLWDYLTPYQSMKPLGLTVRDILKGQDNGE